VTGAADRPNAVAFAGKTISEILRFLAHEFPNDRITIGDIVETLEDRAFGLLMLFLALPMAVPLSAIPGVSTVFGVPLIVIAAQVAIGLRRPALPRWLRQRSISRADLAKVVDWVEPYLKRVERIVHPRWPLLTSFLAERLMGTFSMLLAIVMSLPIVLGNQPPAIAISLFAIAILEKDGLFSILGAVAGVAAIAIVAVVLSAFAAAFWYALTHLFG
jgi:hypothetical protein